MQWCVRIVLRKVLHIFFSVIFFLIYFFNVDHWIWKRWYMLSKYNFFVTYLLTQMFITGTKQIICRQQRLVWNTRLSKINVKFQMVVFEGVCWSKIWCLSIIGTALELNAWVEHSCVCLALQYREATAHAHTPVDANLERCCGAGYASQCTRTPREVWSSMSRTPTRALSIRAHSHRTR